MRLLVKYIISIIIAITPLILIAQSQADGNDVAIMYSDRFLLHNTGEGHPERPERLSKIANKLKNNSNLAPFLIWPSIKEATTEELKLVHTNNYINLVGQEVSLLKGNQIAYLSTGDTVISKKTDEVARLAVGAGIEAADQIMSGKVLSAFVLNRPPGHHATSSKGMGFCVYNNIAIVARYLQNKYKINRILILDFDVHHGNGTQDIFYEDNSVFYFSVHQHPFYPQSGRPSETGIGKGKGFTLNVDLPKNSGDNALFDAFTKKLSPAMDKFKPEFILVSAGFDAHEGDLLGGLNYTSSGYKKVAFLIKGLAKKYSSGRTIYMLEGGYVEENISNSVSEILDVLIKKTH
jgi:acetoin utilization deacetylase AcuC-like enzyme